MKEISVLIFEPYPFNSEGGNQRTLNYLIDFINKKIFKLIFLSPLDTEFVDQVRSRGIECLVIEPSKRIQRYGGKALKDSVIGRLFSMIDLVIYNLKVVSLFKKKKIDVLYSNCIRAVLTVGLAAKLARVPNVWYIKGELNNRFLDFIGFLLADKILFFCHSNKKDKYPGLVRFFEKKIEILKIGIDPRTIYDVACKDKTRLKKELSIDSANTNIIILGQLYALKGVHILLTAFAKIVNEFSNIRLYIVGDHVIEDYSAYKAELEDIIERNSMQDKVVFTGWRRDALEILDCMDLLVHPSFSEGFGRAVLEAMSLGKAVVASRVGGLREIIKDGWNGFLVDPGDANTIMARLSLLIKNENLRKSMGINARNTVFSEYMIQDKIERMQNIFLTMACRNKY